ncbi:flagellin [Psychromonas sp. KJ10-10]|uniref:flagellin n=1 Tax=Psychromonas sp. KJ10-10 TaxID=3391823 RepID=UPI0039B3B328
MEKISESRAGLGAIQNRLDSTISNLENVSQNLSASNSRIQDADFAEETSKMSKAQILQQAGTSMLSQANASAQSVLSLLG